MVVRGQFMDSASSTIDLVVEEGTKDYAIVITENPAPVYALYGIRNKTTKVDEFTTSNLARARHVIVALQTLLDAPVEAMDAEFEDVSEATAGTIQ